MEGLLIDYVQPDSIAEELEIEAGDRLMAINGVRMLRKQPGICLLMQKMLVTT